MTTYYVDNYGAVCNECVNNAKAIQKAIDECTNNGGGRVTFKENSTYLSGSICLKKNVEFYIPKGTILKASPDINDYYMPLNDDGKNKDIPRYAFIHGFEADSAEITGEGVIDGNDSAFITEIEEYHRTGFYPRPTLIYIEKSNHISFKDFTIVNSPFWTLHPCGCNDVLISRIRILNNLDVANSDGIDPDHCKNVRIKDCHIECADDCIVMKNTKDCPQYGACENIIISGCTLISTSAAIKIGTEGVSDFRNIIVDNCIITKSNRGLSIQIRDGGDVENVTVSNTIIETRRFFPGWWGTSEPIAITTFNRKKDIESGKIRNIRFNNITCKGENGVLVHGNEKNIIKDIVFENVSISLVKTSKWDLGVYDLRPGYNCNVIESKNAGFYMRYADSVKLENTKFYKLSDYESFGEAIDAAFCESLKIID